MSAELTRNPLDEQPSNVGVAKPGSSFAANGARLAYIDPELLRWRAEVLLDEMMLGGVDLAASGPLSAFRRTVDDPQPTPASRPGSEPERSGKDHAPVSNEYPHNGRYSSAAPAILAEKAHHESYTDLYPGRPSPPPPYPSQPSSEATGSQLPGVAPASPPESQPEPSRWLFSAEERYRQLARTQEPSTVAAFAINQTTEQVSGGMASAGNLTGNYRWPDEEPGHERSNGSSASEVTATMAPSAVRRASPTYTGTATTTAATARRSTLLPRMSTANGEALQREIYTLLHTNDTHLPATHESHKRVQHLLEKAQTILHSDPMRSAEVEYYLQQVRTIFQRVQQTLDWSNLYRSRLSLYLISWIGLALLVLVGRYLYQVRLEGWLVNARLLAGDGWAIHHIVTGLAAFFSGGLGGAVGALFNLRRQSRMPHGFIDRKFGLRGLILPLIGAIVGGILYLLIGALYVAAGINPAQDLLFSTAPAVLAFAFGVSQESIYGTRE